MFLKPCSLREIHRLIHAGASFGGRYLLALAWTCSNALNLLHHCRLFLVLASIFPGAVLEHSSSSHSKDRGKEQVLDAYKKGSSRILVTSDALTRGLDIPGVELVINYDTPTYSKTYVHRAGRTARAGTEGSRTLIYLPLAECSILSSVLSPDLSQHPCTCWKALHQISVAACYYQRTGAEGSKRGFLMRCEGVGTVITLLSTEQVHHYKAMLRKIDNTFVKDLPLQAGAISALRPKVKQAIESVASQAE